MSPKRASQTPERPSTAHRPPVARRRRRPARGRGRARTAARRAPAPLTRRSRRIASAGLADLLQAVGQHAQQSAILDVQLGQVRQAHATASARWPSPRTPAPRRGRTPGWPARPGAGRGRRRSGRRRRPARGGGAGGVRRPGLDGDADVGGRPAPPSRSSAAFQLLGSADARSRSTPRAATVAASRGSRAGAVDASAEHASAGAGAGGAMRNRHRGACPRADSAESDRQRGRRPRPGPARRPCGKSLSHQACTAR